MAPGQNSEPAHWPAWMRLGAVVAARAVLAMVAGLLVWAVAPTVASWQSTTVMSGSMQPRLMVGDVAVSRPAQATDLRIGEVLLFDDPDHPGRLRMHRFVGVDDNGLLITRGDANPAADSTHLRTGAVRGIGTLRIPVIGTPLLWLQEGEWWKVGLVVGGIGLVLALAVTSPVRDAAPVPERSTTARPRRADPRSRPLGRRTAATAVIIGCLAISVVVAVGTGTGWAAYASVTSSGAQWTAADAYRTTSAASSTLTVNATADSSGWYIQAGVPVTITATASGSARVASVSYRVGSGSVITVNGASTSFTLSTQGTTNVSYWATDGNGLVEVAHTAQIRLDKTKPNLTLTNPSSGSPTTTQWLQACAADFSGGGICGQTDDGTGIGVASVRYTLQDNKGHYWKGNGAFVGSPTTMTATLDGSGHWSSPVAAVALTGTAAPYVLTVTSTDQLGNATTTTITFTLG